LPPALAFAKVEGGDITINQFVAVPQQRRVLITKTTADGKTIEEPMMVIEPLPILERKVIPLAEARAVDLTGKPLPSETLAERLKQESVVVIAAGASVEPRYRKAFRDDVVVLLIPPERKPVKK
jgi:hypothetical protein